MYRDDSIDARVAKARVDQRRLINQWRADGYTCTDTYAERLRRVLASALELPTYAGLYERQRHLVEGFIAGSAAGTREILGALQLFSMTTNFSAISTGYYRGIPFLDRGVTPIGPDDLFLR